MLWSPNAQLIYPFENQANDYSGNARHGTVNGSGVYATRPNAGRCLYFDGTGDYVSTPSFGLSGTVVVFAAHVRMNTGTYQTLLSEAAQSNTVGFLWLLRDNDNGAGALEWVYANGSARPLIIDSTFFDNPYNDAWLHLCVVCDYSGKVTYFYRNALLRISTAMTGTPVFPVTNRPKYIGSYGTSFMIAAGYLQNVQLWTLATMPAAAQMLANANRLMLGMNPIW